MVFQPVELGDQVVVGESLGTISAKRIDRSFDLRVNLSGGIILNLLHSTILQRSVEGVTVQMSTPEDHLLRVFICRSDDEVAMKSFCQQLE